MDKEHIVIKKKRGEDGYKVFSVHVREDIVSRIDEIASESGSTFPDGKLPTKGFWQRTGSQLILPGRQ